MPKFSSPSWISGGAPAGTDKVVGLSGSANKSWTWAQAASYINGLLTAVIASKADDAATTSALASKADAAATAAALAGKADAVATAAAIAAKADSSAVAAALLAIDPCNPLAAPVVKDEFLFNSTETGEGGLGWSFTNGTFNLSPGAANHPGICARASTAVAGVIASMFSGGGGAASAVRFDQLDEQGWVIQPQSAVLDHDVRIGYSVDFTTATPSAGFYFEHLQTDTNWFGVARQAGVQTRVDMGVAYGATWNRFRLRRLSAALVGFSIDGATELTIATNVPGATAALVLGNHIIPQTANARTVWFDLFWMRLLPQAR